MLFITLVKFRKKLTKADMEGIKAGLKETNTIASYFTLGRYDAIFVNDCPDEKSHMKVAMQFYDLASSETMAAITAEEAEALIE
jgi:uncharacterized protein with GYD domain